MKITPVLPMIVLLSAAADVPEVHAQVAEFASVRSWKCEFPVIVSNDWLEPTPAPEIGVQDMGSQIDNVDLNAGTARMIGNVGSSDLFAVGGVGQVTFIEVTPGGSIHITAIFESPVSGRGFKATQSRHIAILGDPLPSQAYGYCRPWD